MISVIMKRYCFLNDRQVTAHVCRFLFIFRVLISVAKADFEYLLHLLSRMTLQFLTGHKGMQSIKGAI